jgi:hypothetical protein
MGQRQLTHLMPGAKEKERDLGPIIFFEGMVQ